MILRKDFSPKLIAASIAGLSLGGVGGSFQASRLILLLLIVFVVARLSKGLNTPLRLYPSKVLAFSLMLATLAIATLTWSIDRSTSLGYVAVLLINLLPVTAVSLMTEDELFRLRQRLPVAWMFAAAAVLPLAFYELATGDHFTLGLQERGGGTGNMLPFASGLHGNFNDFSLFLVFCVFGMSFARSRATPRWLLTLILIIGALACIVILINTSRGAILTLFGLLFSRFLIGPGSSKVLLFSTLPLFFLAWMFSAIGLEGNELTKYLGLKFTDFSSDLESEAGRLAILLAGLKGISSTYGLGVGAGAASVYLASYSSVAIPNPHNVLLEWGLNFGLPGLALLIWLLIYTINATRKITIPEHRRLALSFLILIPLFGIIQSHLTGYTYFWLALATTIAFAITGIKKTESINR